MRSWFRSFREVSGARRPVRRPSFRLGIDCLEDRCLLSNGFVQTALVSDIPGLAPNTDKELINPWQFFETPDGQFRVSSNGAGQAIQFNAQGQKSAADINIPPPLGSPAGSISHPNGVVPNTTSGFVITVKGRSAPATLLFSTEDGTIAGWNPSLSQTRAVIAADQSASGAVYKLLSLDTNSHGTFILATDFRNGKIDIFDSSFHPVARGTDGFGPNAFADSTIPSGFAPFGVKVFGDTVFVTYAKQDASKTDEVPGVGDGFIDEFDTSGSLIGRFASGGLLNDPIGATIAPAGFGPFGGDVLIGNFGDSKVNVFTPSGQFLGQLSDRNGNPLILNGGVQETDTRGLWGIGFGNGQGGAGTTSLFFADGPNLENDGVFGMVNPDPAGNDPPSADPPHGDTKRLVFVPSPQISGLELTATAAIASNDIWATGNVVSGPGMVQPVVEHFDGKSWSVVPTPSFNSDDIAGVAGVASNDVWAVGSVTTVSHKKSSTDTLIEHWNGSSWSVVPTPNPPNGGLLNAVTAVSSNDVWAVGSVLDSTGAPVAALVEHWDGTSWSIVSSPAFASVTGLGSASADASNDVRAASGTTVLHFNGTSWSAVTTGTPVSIQGIKALSPTNVWAVGQGPDADGDSFFARIEHFDGTSWSIVPTPSVNPPEPLDTHSELDGIAAISANDMWAVGEAVGKTLTEHWDGASWSVISSPNPGPFNFLHAVTALSDGTVAAVGNEADSSGNSTGLILQDPASAPKAPAAAAVPTATMPTPADAAPVMPAGTTSAARTGTTPALPGAAPADQFFTAADRASQPGSLAGHRSRRPRRRTPVRMTHRPQVVVGSDLISRSGPESSPRLEPR
jgi:uncharacterized protein (TIGR03118 family)